ncbi:MAG: fimbrillin family protein [Bacteroidales bacterium]|nr:fimbrillin family protein [Bacteroidales bacterium]
MSILLSCSKSSLEQEEGLLPETPNYTPSTTPVGFAAGGDFEGGVDDGWRPVSKVVGKTKAVSDFAEGSVIGVFGYYTGTNTWEDADDTATPNFMYNEEVEKGESAWDYSPQKYWPNSTTEKLSFFAYYPHTNLLKNYFGSDIISFPENTTQGVPAITYNAPATNYGSKVDFLYATALDQTKEAGTVSLQFKHLMAKVQFKFTPSGASSVLVKSVGFDVPATGKFSYTEEDELPQWSNLSENTHSINQEASGDGVSITTSAQLVEEFTQYVLPCSLSTINLRISTDGHTYTDVPVTPATSISLVAGKVTTVSFTISIKGITVTATAQPWTQEVISPEFKPNEE